MNRGGRDLEQYQFNRPQLQLQLQLQPQPQNQPHTCLICFRSFRQLATLRQHFSTHTSIKHYTCDVCNKSFGRMSSLILHNKIHQSEKRYKCLMCPRAFHQKGNLRNHIFSHTKARPYRCPSCGHGFNQQSNVMHHIKKVHPDILEESKRLKETKLFMQYSRQSMPCNKNNFITVNAIANDYMTSVLKKNHTPFAILYGTNYGTCITKVITYNVPEGKHVLVPISSAEFKLFVQLIQCEDSLGQSYHFLQIPIVAIIVFKVNLNGQYTYEIQNPHSLELAHME